MTYNEKLIEKYRNFDSVIKTYYQAKDHNDVYVNVDGVVSPLKIDNRQLCAPTDDQGEESSCAAFSIANICESIIWKNTGRIVNLDAHQIYAKAKTLDGMPNEDGTMLECAINAAFQLGGLDVDKLKIGFIYNEGDQTTVDRLKFLLHKYDFLHIGFRIQSGWYKCDNDDYYIDCSGQDLGGHAVVTCGYWPEGLIIQNSWSKSWGAQGFAIMRWQDVLKNLIYACYIENTFTEAR